MFIHIPNILVQQISKDLKTNPLNLNDTELVVQWAVAAMLSGNCLAEAKDDKSLVQTRKYLAKELNGHLKDLAKK